MKTLRITGCIFAGLEFVLSALAVYFIISTRLLSIPYTVIAAVVLFILPVIFILMQKKKVTSVIAILLSILMCCALPFGIYYLVKTNQALDDITGVTTEVDQINVYVAADDPVTTVNEAVAQQYRFGVIANNDTDNVNKTVAKIEADVGQELQLVQYTSILDVAKAFQGQEVNGFIVSSGMVSTLEAMGSAALTGGDAAETAGAAEPAESEATTEDLSRYATFSKDVKIIMENTIETKVEENDTEPADAERFCVYFSGIDTFGSVTAKSRSDVNIIGAVDTTTKQITLISTPRDYWIPLSVSNGVNDKLTHAGIYGIDCSMDTLEMLYDKDDADISLDYYVRLNFSGFQDIIDQLGGIDVNSDATFTAEDSTGVFHYTEGVNHLDGASALAFARDRHSFSDGDFARGRHQMEVIRAVIAKMESSDMLANYGDVMDSMSGSFQTNMTKEEIGNLVQVTLEGDKWNVVSYGVGGTGATKPCYSLGTSASVVIPDDASVAYARELIERTLSDETISQDEITNHAAAGTTESDVLSDEED